MNINRQVPILRKADNSYGTGIAALMRSANQGHGITLQPMQVTEIAGTLVAMAQEIEQDALIIQALEVRIETYRRTFGDLSEETDAASEDGGNVSLPGMDTPLEGFEDAVEAADRVGDVPEADNGNS